MHVETNHKSITDICKPKHQVVMEFLSIEFPNIIRYAKEPSIANAYDA